jgi:uncharacterized protein (TIGR02246 family)
MEIANSSFAAAPRLRDKTTRRTYILIAVSTVVYALLPAIAFAVDDKRTDCEQNSLRYAWAMDSSDATELANTFTEDGVWEVLGQRLIGREAIRNFIEQWRKQNVDGIGTRMIIDNQIIDVIDETRAVGKAYFTIYRFQRHPKTNASLQPLFFTRSEDEYRFTAEGCKLSRRTIVDVARLDPPSR